MAWPYNKKYINIQDLSRVISGVEPSKKNT